MSALTPGIKVLAFKLQEAMVQSDVRARLQDAVNDAHRGTGEYGYYIDHTGDGESGDCIYCCNGDIRSAPYEIGTQGGKAVAHIDMENSVNVVPLTTYQEEADEDDHYAGMQESFAKSNIYTELPVYERFISKGERDSADEGSFAGKGKSFPILKPGDVSAAVHAMGRAGSGNYGMAQLKANIIRIAKKKGWTQYLPKAWRGDTSESASIVGRGPLKLVESSDWRKEIALSLVEAAGSVTMPIKLIAPGKGSSAFYPAEVLKRDGPNVFTKGTHIYINHATSAEEAARPEGDWHKLAGALESNAYWDEAGKMGPGLYGNALFTSDYAPLIKEKAPFTGMSIRASGIAEAKKTHEGLPILKELTGAESVDVVTRAGAGGMILTEAARPNQQEVSDMDAVKLEKLQESLDAGLAKLALREARVDAKEMAVNALESLRLPAEAKEEILFRVLENIPMKDGALDEAKFSEGLKAETQRVGKLIAAVTGNNGRVTGMGSSVTTEIDPEKIREAEKRAKKEAKRLEESEEEVFGRLAPIRVGKVA